MVQLYPKLLHVLLKLTIAVQFFRVKTTFIINLILESDKKNTPALTEISYILTVTAYGKLIYRLKY